MRQRMSDTLQLVVRLDGFNLKGMTRDGSDDKLKHIGHLLSHSFEVEL